MATRKHEADEVIRQLGEALNELTTVMNEAPNSSIGEAVDESNFQVYTQRRGRPAVLRYKGRGIKGDHK